MWHKDEVGELAQKTFFGKPLTIEHMHGSLIGNLHVPPNFSHTSNPGYPAVLLLHGLGGNRHEHGGLFIKTAAALARTGMVILRIDFRGSGETGGDTREISIKTQIEDANDALEHLLSYPYIDKERVSLLGFSFGGLTAACLAARRKDVRTLILWQAVYDMKATLKRLYGSSGVRSLRTRGYMQAGMMQLGPDFFSALDELDVASAAAAYDGSVLLIQGVADTIVPVDTVYHWKRELTSANVELDLIQDADHAFTRDAWAWAAIDRTSDWLQNTLGQGR